MIFAISILVYAEYSTNLNQISTDDKKKLLDYHNIARAQVGSPPLIWSTDMEVAAIKCLSEWKPTTMDHGICKEYEHLTNVGENLASGGDGPGAAVMFIQEKCANQRLSSYLKSYSFHHDDGHYTQVVWKTTQKMSCVQTIENGVIYCHYSPVGNILSLPAYSHLPTDVDCDIVEGKNVLNIDVFDKQSSTVYTTPKENLKTPEAHPQAQPPQTPQNTPSAPSRPPVQAYKKKDDSSSSSSSSSAGTIDLSGLQSLIDEYYPDGDINIADLQALVPLFQDIFPELKGIDTATIENYINQR
eukprot:NODE_267_length_12253_cov_0.255718.p3 type:complete len:300 gc:universal NODE_267_length_12253_cov_0.255718:9873-8974(-)